MGGLDIVTHVFAGVGYLLLGKLACWVCVRFDDVPGTILRSCHSMFGHAQCSNVVAFLCEVLSSSDRYSSVARRPPQ